MFTPFGRKPDPSNAHDERFDPNRFTAPAALGLSLALVLSFAAGGFWAPVYSRELSFLPDRILSPSDLLDFAHGVFSLASYALVHADISHLVLNLCLILPFGLVLERGYGPWPMLRVFWGSALAGVLTHLLIYGNSHGLMGASAGASGLLAAWMRRRLRDGWTFFALTVLWIAANHPRGLGVSESVAWQAHLGGFLAGLVLAPDAPPSESAASAEDSSDLR